MATTRDETQGLQLEAKNSNGRLATVAQWRRHHTRRLRAVCSMPCCRSPWLHQQATQLTLPLDGRLPVSFLRLFVHIFACISSKRNLAARSSSAPAAPQDRRPPSRSRQAAPSPSADAPTDFLISAKVFFNSTSATASTAYLALTSLGRTTSFLAHDE